mmetsp:Transcript_89960/g.188087  ORF Transcript_89960/g.188087 Transcript_89960/m.188087 type:complete len:427 (+) Transcript_89960:134-1414(+)|eukprot:CAMPEP_0206459468 /NCGR_PEP_ID=MMETSP0324_2-20121206/24188_1 /ASSEMBLY_ACC=CAM_ASM_000836 /TAXON_ID=2866 /ORGANISM="Crypthecodinium cohnii, Strain Seligo" /LENGTH=426 /DNA_ID=CAMNT_0053931013 /DNA_START=130 /DNA_END=1410 /DNA_ORIENTATION=+
MGSGGGKMSKKEESVPVSEQVAAEMREAEEVPLETLSIHVPDLPGDIGLSGEMSEDIAAAIAKKYKSWVYFNSPENPNFRKAAIEAAGCKIEFHPFTGPPSAEQAEAMIEAIERLPRPLMLQCSTSLRVGVALMLWLSKKRGYTPASTELLGNDLSLKSFTGCQRCSTNREWLLNELPKHDALPMISKPVGKVATDLVFQQLFDPETSTYTYVLGCAKTKDAILIDPVLEQKDRDLGVLDAAGLKLKYVVNTHCHADHITSGGIIRKERPDVKTVISKASTAKGDILIEEGDKIEFGEYSVSARATPGHTDGCLSYLLEGSPSMIFTGDALLIRGCGRTDFQQGNSETLYESVHGKILSLPGETLIYPGHDYKGRNVSTVAEELKFNPRLTATKEGFVKIMSELNLPYPKQIDRAVPANLVCGVQD